MRILVIEDEKEIRNFLKVSLETECFVVDIAEDGEAGINYLRDHAVDMQLPSLILLDLNLPKKNGYEVLDEIKHDERLCSIPVVIFSTSERPEDVSRAYALGANCYVQKPSGFTDYVKTIRTIQQFWFATVRLPEA